MPQVKINNNAASRLASSLTAGSTSLSVQAGDGAKFPTLTAGQWFPVTALKSTGQLEIMRCTARSGDILTVTRAQEGTAALAFDAGDRLELRVTAAAFAEFMQDYQFSDFIKTLIDDADAAAARSTLGLGNAATATLQSSASDPTAGRILLNGAHGLGLLSTVDPSNNWPATSLNDVTGATQGFWRTLGATTDLPPGHSPANVVLFQIRQYAAGIALGYAQIVIDIPSGIWSFRTSNGSGTPSAPNWSAWNRVYHSGEVFNERAPVTLASAATTNIGAATANTITVTGTTTITSFGTFAAGATRRVVFSGALTLTHNATSLILPGGANITTAAGDVAEFVSLGSGNWRCIGYQKSNGESLGANPRRLCTAWVNFNGTGSVAIRDSYNVSSIVDDGVGNYKVNFTSAMANDLYSSVVTTNSDGVGIMTAYEIGRSTTQWAMNVANTVAQTLVDRSRISIQFFGGVA